MQVNVIYELDMIGLWMNMYANNDVNMMIWKDRNDGLKHGKLMGQDEANKQAWIWRTGGKWFLFYLG